MHTLRRVHNNWHDTQNSFILVLEGSIHFFSSPFELLPSVTSWKKYPAGLLYKPSSRPLSVDNSSYTNWYLHCPDFLQTAICRGAIQLTNTWGIWRSLKKKKKKTRIAGVKLMDSFSTNLTSFKQGTSQSLLNHLTLIQVVPPPQQQRNDYTFWTLRAHSSKIMFSKKSVNI